MKNSQILFAREGPLHHVEASRWRGVVNWGPRPDYGISSLAVFKDATPASGIALSRTQKHIPDGRQAFFTTL